LKDVTGEQFHLDSFVMNDTKKIKRDEGEYKFERDWPKNEIPVEGEDHDSDEDEDYDDELMGMIGGGNTMTSQMLKMQMKDKNKYMEGCSKHGPNCSCTCSSCSEDEEEDTTERDNYLDAIQRRNVRAYLDSMILPGTDANDMDLEKASGRDLERLIPDSQTDEEDFLMGAPRDTSQSFGNQSTASASQLGRPSRQSINENDKQKIREALKGIKNTDIDEVPWFKQKSKHSMRYDSKMDEVQGDYLVTTNTANLKPIPRPGGGRAPPIDRRGEILGIEIAKRQREQEERERLKKLEMEKNESV